MTTAVGGVAELGAAELCCATCAPAHPNAARASNAYIRLRIFDFIVFPLFEGVDSSWLFSCFNFRHIRSRRFPLISFGITGATITWIFHFCPKASGWTGIYCGCKAILIGSGPIFITLATTAPIGNVSMLPLLFTYQFTSMLGDVPTLHPSLKKYETK